MASRGAGHGGLTERDRFWLEHLERQAASAETSKAYAAREELSISAFYQARMRLIAAGAWQAARKRVRPQAASAPLFTRLALPVPAPSAAATAACRLRLASGVVVEWSAPPPVEVLVSLALQIAAPR
jgi:hypothetical protein